jgi:hypothetical protein
LAFANACEKKNNLLIYERILAACRRPGSRK